MSAVHVYGELKTETTLTGHNHKEPVIFSLGDLLLRGNPAGYYDYAKTLETLEYYDATKCKWCECAGIKKRKFEVWETLYRTCILKPFTVNIPKNKENADICSKAIYFDDTLYVLNTATLQFTAVNILSGTKIKTVELFSPAAAHWDIDRIKVPPQQMRYNGRCFIIWKGFLYELEWCYDNKTTLIIITTQHLKWISSFDRLFVCGNYGIALTMRAHPICHNKQIKNNMNWSDEINDYLICYEPNQQIIYRLTQNDVQLEGFEERGYGIFISSVVWLNDTQSIAVRIGDYAFRISDTVLRNMKCRECKDCYDENEYKYDSSFTEWEPQFNDDAESDSDGIGDFATYMSKSFGHYINYGVGFNKMKSGHPLATDGDAEQPLSESRAEFLYCCYHPSTNYRIVAGLHIEKQPHYSQLKHLKAEKYKQLSRFGDLADYLGAVIWYQRYRYHGKNVHTVEVATIVDFRHRLRSSNWITTIRNNRGMHSVSFMCVADCAWIGVIDSGKPHNKWNKRKVNVPSLIYAGLYSNHFEVTKGRIVCTDMNMRDKTPQFGNTMKGKWHWKSNSIQKMAYTTRQLLAYHESVQHDSEYADCWDIPNRLFLEQTYENQELFEIENEDQDLLPLDSITTSEKEFSNLLKLLYSIQYVENVADDLVIREICEFCYFSSSLNWIKKPVLNGKWYLHRQIVECDDGNVGIFDYDHFEDAKVIQDPYSGKKGYEWFHFEEKNGNDVKNDFWKETIKQSLQRRDPCSVPYGCAASNENRDVCSCLVKLNPISKQVVCVRLVFNNTYY